eukprot:scaffold41981_cov20-Tisochrysis_lutea.AAC.1
MQEYWYGNADVTQPLPPTACHPYKEPMCTGSTWILGDINIFHVRCSKNPVLRFKSMMRGQHEFQGQSPAASTQMNWASAHGYRPLAGMGVQRR